MKSPNTADLLIVLMVLVWAIFAVWLVLNLFLGQIYVDTIEKKKGGIIIGIILFIVGWLVFMCWHSIIYNLK